MGKEVYSAEEIQKYKDGSDPYNYPNEHYLDKLLGNKGLQTGHELTVNGGNDKTQYMVSFRLCKTEWSDGTQSLRPLQRQSESDYRVG